MITLFHKPSLSASNRVLTLLKQGSAHAQETATEDQATDHSHQNESVKREPFELDVTESVPTEDQIRSIIEYVGQNKIGQIVEGATSVSDAAKKLAADENAFKRPITVDWNQGRAGTSIRADLEFEDCADVYHSIWRRRVSHQRIASVSLYEHRLQPQRLTTGTATSHLHKSDQHSTLCATDIIWHVMSCSCTYLDILRRLSDTS